MARVALVIGETDNLCEAICIKLAALQYRVIVMFDNDDQRRNEWLALMKIGGCDLQVLTYDAENGDEAGQRIALIAQQTGSIEVLVLSRSEYAYPQSLLVLARQICWDMVAHGYGRIVGIDFPEQEEKAEAESAIPSWSQKPSMQDFMTTLTAEVADKKVTANIITAGCIGKSVVAVSGDTLKTGTESPLPTEYLNQQQEIASLVAYLVSDEATFINGANIAVNAGRYLGAPE